MGAYRLIVLINYSDDWKVAFAEFCDAANRLSGVEIDKPKSGLISIIEPAQVQQVLDLAREYRIHIKIVPEESI